MLPSEHERVMTADSTSPVLAEWRVHTPNLLKEVLNNPVAAMLAIPMNVLGKLLAAVGERASELNDRALNKLMLRLTIYSAADPESPEYDASVLERYGVSPERDTPLS